VSAREPRRLSALVVNHDSGAFALRCVESLAAEWARAGRERDDLELVVFDSGSGPGEETWWRSLRRAGARVITSAANVGYAAGIGRAWEATSGAPDDAVAILNADLCFLSGSLEPLLEHLARDPLCGAAAPRAYVDAERQIRLPRIPLPGPRQELGEALARLWPRRARARAALRFSRSLEWWQHEGVLEADMLSGACLFLRREVAAALARELGRGGPLDRRFPLYYEDADLCRRITARGLRLAQVADSEIVHHWSRSAGCGADFARGPARKQERSRRAYLAKHHGPLAAGACSLVRRCADRRAAARGELALHPCEALGELAEPPLLRLPRLARFALEIALTPGFGLVAGVLGEGAELRLSFGSWSWLFPATYHARALDRGTGELLGAWSFTKTTPARSWPLDPAEIGAPAAAAPRPAAFRARGRAG